MKLDLLVFAAHPDDAELACSGTILKYVAEGKKIGIVDLTQGELGTRGSAELRAAEAAASAEILGLSIRENLGLRDGFFVNDEPTRLKVIEAIRRYQPEIILANAASDRHPDHGRASALLNDAVFLAGLTKIETHDGDDAQKPWRPALLLHYIQDQYLQPDILLDITPFWEQKLASIRAFKSQFFDPTSHEPHTYISSPDFLHTLEARCREFGKSIKVTYAEGFTSNKLLGVQSLFDLR
ncbi:MAG: Mycothiol S-conjugate amidase [Bacteroidota bacterium]|jgi:bacillithiol biosynthesis deacetylase BshB1